MKTTAKKREEAIKRNLERAERTDEQQLHRLSVGRYDAKRERARLIKRIESERAKK